MRWHIDYLLRWGKVIEVKRYGNDRKECELSSGVEKLPGSKTIVRGFGSSDCKCSTHLFYFRLNPVGKLGQRGVQRNTTEHGVKIAR